MAAKKKMKVKNRLPRKKSASQTGSIVYSELNAPDIEKAAHFYREVMGFESQKVEVQSASSYTVLSKGKHDIFGVVQAQPGQPAMFVHYHLVDDVFTTAEKTRLNGGKILVEPADTPAGTFAILQDPMGAVFGVVKPRK